MITDAAGLFRQAVALGLVGPADVLDGGAALWAQPRSNLVHRLDLDGETLAYAKQAGTAHRMDGVDPTVRERSALRGLHGVRCVPELLDAGLRVPTADVLWTAPVPGTALGDVDLRRRPVAPIAVAWGAALAALHTAPNGGFFAAPPAPRPWILVPDRLPRWARRCADAELPAMVLAALREDRDLRRARAVVARWWPASRPPAVAGWVHGDPSPSNVLVGIDGRVRFIDFEDAGLGDPSWDLACALTVLREVTAACGLSPEDGRAELTASYAAHGGPGRVGPEYLSLACVLLAWQFAAAPGAGDDMSRQARVGRLLDRARDHAARRDDGRRGSVRAAGAGR